MTTAHAGTFGGRCGVAKSEDYPSLQDVGLDSPVPSGAILSRWEIEAAEMAEKLTPDEIAAKIAQGGDAYRAALAGLGLDASQIEEVVNADNAQRKENPAVDADGIRPQTGQASILRFDQRGENPGDGNQDRSPQTTQTGPSVRKVEAASADALTALLQHAQTEITAGGATIINTKRKRETRYIAYITYE